MENTIETFLISEYNALQARALGFETILSSRINLFLIVNGASIAGFSGLSQIDNFDFNYKLILNFLCSINLLIGIVTLKFSKDQSIAITSFQRRAARIRRYFYDKNPDIYPYLPFYPSDERPKYFIGRSLLIWRGGDPILIVINSLLSGIISYNLLYEFSNPIGLVVSFLVFFILMILQIKYLEIKLLQRDIDEEKEGKVNFLNEDLKRKEQARAIKT